MIVNINLGVLLLDVVTIYTVVIIDIKDAVLDVTSFVGNLIVRCDGDFTFCNEIVKCFNGVIVIALLCGMENISEM
jgi:hypothetical protein